MQLCGRTHYHATRRYLDSRTQLDEPVECASGGDPLLLYKILYLLFYTIRILCALCLESRKKIINMALIQDLWNFSFFGRGNVSPTHSEICHFVFQGNRHNFLFLKSSFRIWNTTVLGMFKDSAFILDVIWWSFLTKSSTAAMFTSVRVHFGRPPLLSSSTSSFPSQNRTPPKNIWLVQSLIPISLLYQY
jgi:hypothetical protein